MADIRRTILVFINRMLNIHLSCDNFPGYQPVSVSRNNIEQIQGYKNKQHWEYVVSYKADGERMYLGFLSINQTPYCFTVNRLNHISIINISQCGTAIYNGSLFDVEFIQNTNNFIIFDCLCINGSVCTNELYLNRMEIVRICIGNIREIYDHDYKKIDISHIPTNCIYKSNVPNIQVKINNYWFQCKILFYAHSTSMLPTNWIYPNDGFIWTLNTAPYPNKFHMDNNEVPVFKWKPVEKNTVDFRVGPINPDICLSDITTHPCYLEKYESCRQNKIKKISCVLYTSWKGQSIVFSFITGYYVDGIYECGIDTTGNWYVVSKRNDKNMCNSLNTVLLTLKNIDENISKGSLSIY